MEVLQLEFKTLDKLKGEFLTLFRENPAPKVDRATPHLFRVGGDIIFVVGVVVLPSGSLTFRFGSSNSMYVCYSADQGTVDLGCPGNVSEAGWLLAPTYLKMVDAVLKKITSL